jgi:cytochrome b561
MAAQAERSLRTFADTCAREKGIIALYGCIALATVVVGVSGLLDTSRLRLMPGLWLHALFAVLLCGLVLARWWWCIGHSAQMLPVDVRQLARHLSRSVYLCLYLVIGVREVVGIVYSLWHGAAVDFNLFDPRFRQGPDSSTFNAKDDFQLFFASGLFALMFVRILVFGPWYRSGERGAPADTAEATKPARLSRTVMRIAIRSLAKMRESH